MNSLTWINASAGSGKTKQLIDRIVLLLLKGVQKKNILCLTFTKAAALEMEERLEKVLTDVVNTDPDKLYEIVPEITKEDFVTVKDSLNNLKNADPLARVDIRTIHSFSEGLVRRYARDLGMTNQFTIIGESESRKLLEDSLKEFIADTSANNWRKPFIHIIARNFNEERLLDLLLGLFQELDCIDNVDPESVNVYCADFFKLKNIDFSKVYFTYELEYSFLCERKDLFDELIKQIKIHNLPEYSDFKRKFQNALEVEKLNIEAFEAFWSLFITNNGTIRKKILKTTETPIKQTLERVKNVLHELLLYRSRFNNVQVSIALNLLVIDVYQRYLKNKRSKDVLDYDDLIRFAIEILIRADTRIFWELDNNIKHLLIDESQDTSIRQWRVVELMTKDFFTTLGTANKTKKSLFVVGDIKQSIYSFQGVSTEYNLGMKRSLVKVARDAGCISKELFSNTSYRSNGKILEIVDKVFEEKHMAYAIAGEPEIKVQHNFFFERNGEIIVWPLIKRTEEENDDLDTRDINSVEKPYQKLSRLVTEFIKTKIGTWIPSECRNATADDFFVLFQRRTRIITQLVKDLDEAGIKNTGADKIILQESQPIKDLISIAKFVINPQDDMSLAIVLRSPFIGISEEELFKLCNSRKGLLIERVKELMPDNYKRLIRLLNYSELCSIYEFFVAILKLEEYELILKTRFGAAIENLLCEFCDLVFEYESVHGINLERFVLWFLTNENAVTNKVQSVHGVKLSTVHGAKGLESPFVLIIDANVYSIKHKQYFCSANHAMYIVDSYDDKAEGMLESLRENAIMEYYRLLYVAMTRAKDGLYIFGAENLYESHASWYNKILAAIETFETTNNLKRNADGSIQYCAI